MVCVRKSMSWATSLSWSAVGAAVRSNEALWYLMIGLTYEDHSVAF
jgi:hypothetical protein